MTLSGCRKYPLLHKMHKMNSPQQINITSTQLFKNYVTQKAEIRAIADLVWDGIKILV